MFSSSSSCRSALPRGTRIDHRRTRLAARVAAASRPHRKARLAALVLALTAPALHAASLKMGGFVDPGSVMRPALPLVGVSYASHVDERLDAALVHRPLHFSSQEPGEGLRLRSCERTADGDDPALFGETSCASAALAGAPLPLTRGSGLQLLTPPNGLPAPMLVPSSTELSLKVGRISEDAVDLAAGTDFVMLGNLRHGLTPRNTLSATALRVGPAHLLSATSDWRLGTFGVVRGGVGLFDRGNGTQSRTVLGHDFQFRNLSTGLHWGRSNRPEPGGEHAFAISGAAWRALPEDGDTLAATASVHLGRHAQLVLTGREHEPWEGERARLISLGSSYQPNDENQIGLTVQHTLSPEPDQRLLLTWQMNLDQ